jgi:cytidylate kinase
MIIGIDGPAGTGKTTIAKIFEEKYNIKYINTGAMYRALAYKCLQNRIEKEEEEDILKILEDTKIEYVKNSVNGKMLTSIILDGKDITEEIHRVDIAQVASDISKIVKVREYMVDLQRKIANEYVKMDEDVLLEGRDICTVVFPDADLKIYLDADTKIRAKRRLEELKNRGINENLNLEEMIKSIEKRDETDKNKTVGALKRTENQKYIDTTDKKIDDVITEILGEIERIRKDNVR